MNFLKRLKNKTNLSITVTKDTGNDNNPNTIRMIPKSESNPTIEIVHEAKNPEITIEVVKADKMNEYMNNLEVKEVYSGGEYISGLKSSDGFGVEWYNKVVDIAKEHGMSAEDLLSIINLESTLNPGAKRGDHYGFMQMDSDCFKEAGYTKDQYIKMSPIEKLDVINAHLYNLDRKCGKDPGTASIEDYYAANLLPVNAKKDVVIDKFNRPESYNSNSGLDYNKDGKITKSELKKMLETKKVDITSFMD